jgi:hypothetical protein
LTRRDTRVEREMVRRLVDDKREKVSGILKERVC